ncbi:MAG TPA: hypothetical protein VLF67_01180 [Candidatus Saccharimonas sp.]|nr:hypothetical protein [Candidatus Saccharimonas sp.]
MGTPVLDRLVARVQDQFWPELYNLEMNRAEDGDHDESRLLVTTVLDAAVTSVVRALNDDELRGVFFEVYTLGEDDVRRAGGGIKAALEGADQFDDAFVGVVTAVVVGRLLRGPLGDVS